jgi:hypothetical protein
VSTIHTTLRVLIDGKPAARFPMADRLDLATAASITAPAVSVIDEQVDTTGSNTTDSGGNTIVSNTHLIALRADDAPLRIELDDSDVGAAASLRLMPSGLFLISNTNISGGVGWFAEAGTAKVRGVLGGNARFD